MFIYIIVYLLLLFAFLFGRRKKNGDQHAISWCLIIMFTLLRGLRWKTGTDWDYYEDIFGRVDQYITYKINLVETGFLYFNKIVKSIYDNYTFYLIVSNFLLLFSYYKLCDRLFKNNVLEAFCICVMCMSLFPVRQNFAVAVGIWALPFIQEKKYLKSALTIIIASTIHRTLLVMLPFLFPFIYKSEMNYLVRIGLYVGAFLFNMVLGLDNLIANYIFPFLPEDGGAAYRVTLKMSSEEEDRLIGLTTVIITCIIIVAIKYIRKKEKSDILLIVFNAYYIGQMISVLFQKGVIADFSRMATCFSWGYFIMIFLIYKNISNRNIATTFIIFMFVYKFAALFASYTDLLIPYYSVFDTTFPRNSY